MTTTKRRTATPSPVPLPDLPAALDGWTWQQHSGTSEVQLRSRDYHTKWYYKPDRAIAEAERYVQSRPKATPIEQQPTIEAIDAAVRSGDTAALVATPAPAALSADLQDLAERYILSREAAGDSLLDMAEAI